MQKSEITHESVTQILRLVDALPDGEVRIEIGDIKLHMRKGQMEVQPRPPEARAVQTIAPPSTSEAAPPKAATAPPDQRSSSATRPAESPKAEAEAGLIAVRAPMLGRFYRASSPGDAPFVEQGSRVTADQAICLIEVMKLFNTVSAGVAGTVVEIVAENNTMVEFDQILFTIRPG
jgi:acetyl-CoA carboxylase biotin carboxyl carrier protein